MPNKKSSAGSRTHPMVGVTNTGGVVKQPIKAPKAVTGTKAGKPKLKGSKTIQTNQGTSGIMRQPRG